MSMRCSYHSDREAYDTCEICGKPVCTDCMRTLIQTRMSYKSTSALLSVPREVCPECYYDGRIKETFPKSALLIYSLTTFSCVILVVMLIIAEIQFRSLGGLPSGMPTPGMFLFIFIIPIIVGGVLIIYMLFISRPKKKERLIKEKEEFLRSVGLEKRDSSLASSSSTRKKNINICPNCGEKIDSTDRFCNDCGTLLK